MKKKIFAFIFARENSKRVKNKNIRKINDNELINFTIDLAKKIKLIDKIFVSTDSKKIINLAKKKNINYILRPKKLCTSYSQEILSWKHSIKFLEKKGEKFDYFLSLPPTSPLRNKEDILKLIKNFSKFKSDLTITVTKTNRIPYFNMVKINKFGFVNIAEKKKNYSKKNIFDITTVGYISTPKYILKSKNIFKGKVRSILIPRERALDIDDEYDLKLAKLLLKK
tara:strand:+ start:3439 stop:4113 length:675 start_codon:yes stop_codon:yes gene_type:complete